MLRDVARSRSSVERAIMRRDDLRTDPIYRLIRQNFSSGIVTACTKGRRKKYEAVLAEGFEKL